MEKDLCSKGLKPSECHNTLETASGRLFVKKIFLSILLSPMS